MDELGIFKDAPKWLIYAGFGLGGLGAALFFMRQWLSSAKVDRTANESNVATILRLQDELHQERERNDNLMREREAMATELGGLRAEVKALREQVEMLAAVVRGQRKHEA